MVLVSNTAQLQTDTIIRQPPEISAQTESIVDKSAREWGMKQGRSYDSWLAEAPDKASAAITCCIIRSIWRDLMKRSKMLSLINTKNYYKWNSYLENNDVLKITVFYIPPQSSTLKKQTLISVSLTFV